MPSTQTVTNQAPPLEGYNLAHDPLVREALAHHGATADWRGVEQVGELLGSASTWELARRANHHIPELRTHDRFGHRIDEVEFHPSWEALTSMVVGLGVGGAPWVSSSPSAHFLREINHFMISQIDNGVMCPMNTSYASVPTLRSLGAPEVGRYVPGLTSMDFQPGLTRPLDKPGIIAAISVTEKHAGTDLAESTTLAEPLADGSYRIAGHKWFFSAPMSDVVIVTAQTSNGLTCFLVPRILPDGSRNGFRLQRLKTKVGNRSNASAEVEYDDAIGWPIGGEGEGTRTVMKMIAQGRGTMLTSSAASMRGSLSQAIHHANHREVSGKLLINQPLMRNVLADLAIESEAAAVLAFRLAADSAAAAEGNPDAMAFRRIATAVGKYWICKRTSAFTAEAMECLGGNGYIEESVVSRHFTESAVNSIWDGAGNVMALDVARSMTRQPETIEVLMAELDTSSGKNADLDRAADGLRRSLRKGDVPEFELRSLAGQMALVLQGSLLVRYGDPAVAEAFCGTRFSGDWGRAFGTLPRSIDVDAVLDRAQVKVG